MNSAVKRRLKTVTYITPPGTERYSFCAGGRADFASGKITSSMEVKLFVSQTIPENAHRFGNNYHNCNSNSAHDANFAVSINHHHHRFSVDDAHFERFYYS